MAFTFQPIHVLRVCTYGRQRKVDAILPHLNASLEEAQIDSELRAAMYLAQLAHETVDFQFFREIWGGTPEQLRYEPPTVKATELGNTERGDGYLYRGRGAIQLTGRKNYRDCGIALHLPLEEQPDLAAALENAFRVAAWFWVTHERHGVHINDCADKGDVEGATRIINGGMNGLSERWRRYDAACEALGVLSLHFLG